MLLATLLILIFTLRHCISAFSKDIKLIARPEKTVYTVGQLVEFYCTGNLGNQVNTSRPDTVWNWEVTSDDIDNNNWQSYPKLENMRYNFIPQSCNTGSIMTKSSQPGLSTGCYLTGSTSLFHVIERGDDGRHFRCSVQTEAVLYSGIVTVNVDSE